MDPRYKGFTEHALNIAASAWLAGLLLLAALTVTWIFATHDAGEAWALTSAWFSPWNAANLAVVAVAAAPSIGAWMACDYLKRRRLDREMRQEPERPAGPSPSQ